MGTTRALAAVDVYLGLLRIGVKVYPATQEPPSVRFTMLHRRCSSRLKQIYVCSLDNAVVEGEERAKGYEVEPNKYVVFSSEELEALEAPPGEPGIHLMEWLLPERIDPIHYSKAYYLGPGKGSEKSFKLLHEVMTRRGLVPLARNTTRGKTRLVVLRPGKVEAGGEWIVMQDLLHAEEVRPVTDLPPQPVASEGPSKTDLQLATKLVESNVVDRFAPEAYPDESRERCLALIAEKVAGKEIRAPREVEGKPHFATAEAALKASLTPKRASR